MRSLVVAALLVAMAPTEASARLVFEKLETTAIVVARDDGSRRRVVAHGFAPSLSPDGRRLVAAPYAPTLVVTTLAGVSHAYGEPGTGVAGVTFAPDGRRLAYVSLLDEINGPSVDVLDLATGHGGGGSGGFAAAWGARGLAVAYSTFTRYDQENVEYRVGMYEDGVLRTLVSRRDEDGAAWPVAWSANGQTLLTAFERSFGFKHAVLVDRPPGSPRWLRGEWDQVVDLSEDGTAALAIAGDTAYSVPADGGRPDPLVRGVAAVDWTR
ncbi:MAG TPA: hypothetical protein VF587_03435 [Solirubrobacteraceae bacterium]|jgi:hypothetical protein